MRALRVLLGLTMTACAASAAHTGTTPQTTRPVASASPQSQGLTVVGLGDSVMAGTNCGCDGPVQGYAESLMHREAVPTSAVDDSSSGQTAAQLAELVTHDASIRADVTRADVVLVTIGANDLADALGDDIRNHCPRDCYQPVVDTMGRSLDRTLDEVAQLRAGRTTTVLVSTYWNVLADGQVAIDVYGRDGLDWSREVTRAANAVISARTSAHHMSLVDLSTAFLGRDGSGDPTRLLATDGDHPNAQGVAAEVTALIAATPAVLRAR